MPINNASTEHLLTITLDTCTDANASTDELSDSQLMNISLEGISNGHNTGNNIDSSSSNGSADNKFNTADNAVVIVVGDYSMHEVNSSKRQQLHAGNNSNSKLQRMTLCIVVVTDVCLCVCVGDVQVLISVA